MALTTTNAQITVQDGAGAASNVNNGNVGYYTPNALVTFALQSTTGVAKWKLTFMSPSFPSLHQRTLEWVQGQANQFQVQMPSTVSGVANPYGGIELVSVVDDGVQSIASSVCFLQTYGGAAPMVTRYARVATLAALSAYTAANGVLTANSNGTQSVDGVTVAVGDRVLLTMGAASSDNGLYIVTQKGLAGAKFIWTRAPEWPTGATIKSGSTVEVGPEGTALANTTWKATASGDPVVDTTDPAMYPRVQIWTKTLSGGAGTVSNIFALATTSALAMTDITSAAAVKGTITAGVPGTGQIVLAGTTTDVIQGAIINW